jgi:hypothetical protein
MSPSSSSSPAEGGRYPGHAQIADAGPQRGAPSTPIREPCGCPGHGRPRTWSGRLPRSIGFDAAPGRAFLHQGDGTPNDRSSAAHRGSRSRCRPPGPPSGLDHRPRRSFQWSRRQPRLVADQIEMPQADRLVDVPDGRHEHPPRPPATCRPCRSPRRHSRPAPRGVPQERSPPGPLRGRRCRHAIPPCPVTSIGSTPTRSPLGAVVYTPQVD